jgi:hypothetical protein
MGNASKALRRKPLHGKRFRSREEETAPREAVEEQ